ncbi:class I SAM-dependent methyltransferase [bacterium]|nr:class I SAM-dependent methyltransferase [bacterium]
MEKHEYKTMFEFEDDYWWYKGLRNIVINIISRFGDTHNMKLLDAGCGTGGNLKRLSKLFKASFGFDFSPEAVPFWKERGLNNQVLADMNKIPYKDQSFDVIICIDVFECYEVNEKEAFNELVRVLRVGGKLVLHMAAYQFLLSEHDRAVHSVRRYTKRMARKTFLHENTIMIKYSYLFPLTFPVIFISRMAGKMFKRHAQEKEARSDLKPLPRALNTLLYYTTVIENYLLGYVSFPFGSSLMCVFEKVA